ncbi:UNVERIFIED_CONTAM: hypothetical protein RMT77_010909 [Armadillidium vulgare]
MELENFSPNKVFKNKKKMKKSEKRDPKIVPEPEVELEETLEQVSKGKKKKRKYENRDAEIVPEPEVKLKEPLEHGLKKKKRKAEQKEAKTIIELEAPEENATLKFGRRSKDEVNNNNLSPSKSDKEEVSEEPKITKRKSYDSDDTHLFDFDTTANSEFESPSKKMKINSKEFLNDCEKLLSLATEQVTPNSIAYSKTLPKLDYSKIAEHFPDKSTEDLKNELQILIEGTVKVKSLHQILAEALLDVQTEKTIEHTFNNFVNLNHDKITEEMGKRSPGVSRLSVATEMWKKLTVNERRAYRPNHKRSGDKSIGQQPFEIYYSMLKKKEENVKFNDARQRYKDFSVEKKLKFIRKSAKQMMKALEELEEEEPSETLEKKVKGPSKEDAELYLKYYKYPEEPTTFLPIYYCEVKKKELDSKDRLFSAKRAFHELTKEKQEQWKERHRKVKESFDNEVEEWKTGQDKVTLFIWKTFKSPAPKIPKKMVPFKKDKKFNRGKFKMTDYIRQLTYYDVQVSVAKFEDEPDMPPLNPITLFGIELEKRRGERFSPAQLKEHFKSLDKTKQMTLREKCNEMKDEFIRGLKEYVENMSYERRKLFLGVNRVKYIKALHQDIFEENYPHVEYKVYAKPRNVRSPLKRSKKTSGSSQSKHSSNNKDESDEEDEEEEEDMKDFERPKSSKFVEPRNYSSRKKDEKKLTSHEENDNENDDDDEEDDADDDESEATSED